MRSAPVVLKMLFLLVGGWLACSPAAAEESWVNPPGKQKWPAGCQHQAFHSASMNLEVGYNIYLPPDYEKSDRRFPVIYWLYGCGGNESYYAYPTFVGTLAEGVKSKKVPSCICVFANAGKSSWYADGKDGKRLLAAHLDQQIRLWDAASGRVFCSFPAPNIPKVHYMTLNFSADGQYACEGGAPGWVYLWRLPQP